MKKWKQWLKKSKKSQMIDFSLLLGLVNLLLVFQANLSAYQANVISREARDTSKHSLAFEIDVRSQNHLEEAFDDIYENETNLITMNKIKNGQLVNNHDSLLSLVDIFEEVGNGFCQGTTKTRHIKPFLKRSLENVCKNNEIFEFFQGKKNGTAILCYEFFKESLFAETLKRDNLDTCEFIDSSEFENTEKGYQFFKQS